MAAGDSLSSGQFSNFQPSHGYQMTHDYNFGPYSQGEEADQSRTWIPIHHLKNMTGADWGRPIGELHRDYSEGYKDYDWHGLHEYMHKAGTTDRPINVDSEHTPTQVWNGHHRAVAAMESGRMFVPVSTNDQFDPNTPETNHSNQRSRRESMRRPTWESPTTGTRYEHKAAFKVEDPEGVDEDEHRLARRQQNWQMERKGQGKLF